MTTILNHVRWYDYLYLVVCQAISYSAVSSKYISFYQIYLQKAPSAAQCLGSEDCRMGTCRTVMVDAQEIISDHIYTLPTKK
jgi:hypothetical protein